MKTILSVAKVTLLLLFSLYFYLPIPIAHINISRNDVNRLLEITVMEYLVYFN